MRYPPASWAQGVGRRGRPLLVMASEALLDGESIQGSSSSFPVLHDEPSTSSHITRDDTATCLDCKDPATLDLPWLDLAPDLRTGLEPLQSTKLPLVNRAAYQMSKRMRRNLGQSWITNRFLASAPLERDFQAYHTSHQIGHARRRLCFFCLLTLGYSLFAFVELVATSKDAAIGDHGGTSVDVLLWHLYVQVRRRNERRPTVVRLCEMRVWCPMRGGRVSRSQSGVRANSAAHSNLAN